MCGLKAAVVNPGVNQLHWLSLEQGYLSCGLLGRLVLDRTGCLVIYVFLMVLCRFIGGVCPQIIQPHILK